MASVLSLLVLAVTFVLVPLDDRPVTAQLPVMLGALAGVHVATPPRELLGRYLTPGQPDAILRWLETDAPADASAYILSTDMIAYGGLIAARAPGPTRALAISRLRSATALRMQHPNARFLGFGTVMRLAPTGVPAIGDAAGFFAAGEPVELLTEYANLPDPPNTDAQRARAARLRVRLGRTLDAYLATRARDLDVDLFALRQTAEGSFDRLVIGQDDAGPVGLHLRDLAALRSFVERWIPPERAGSQPSMERAAIEPGADELAMILVSAELAHRAQFVPRVRVRYSRPDGATVQDHLEFAPIGTTIADIIRACGARQVNDASADIDLFVRVAGTSPTQEQTFLDAIVRAAREGSHEPRPAIADLTFLDANNMPLQRSLVERMIAAGVAGKIDAFASWNTTANTVGTALPVAIASVVGRREGSFDARAHAQFMLDRYADDYAFHDFTRASINAALSARGVHDHTYLLPEDAARTQELNRADLWPRALALLREIYPQYRDAGVIIELPWDRTFETSLDVRLAPG